MPVDGPGEGTLAAAMQSCSEMNRAETQTIAALQTSGDPSSAASSLRCLRFNNPVDGGEHLTSHACAEGSGPKIEVVPLAVFPGKGELGKYACKRADDSDAWKAGAIALGAQLYKTPLQLADGTLSRDWLANGPGSVRVATNDTDSTGVFLVSVQADKAQAFRNACAITPGLLAFETIDTPNYALVLPSKSAICEELGFISQWFPRNASVKVCLITGNRSIMRRGQVALGFQFPDCHQWVATMVESRPVPTWTNGSPLLFEGLDMKREPFTFVVLGVEGKGGKDALEEYLYQLTKEQPAITWEANSKARRDMVHVAIPWTRAAEESVYPLTASTRSVLIPGLGWNKTYSMHFSPNEEIAAFRLGRDITKSDGGNLQMSLLQTQVDEQRRSLESVQGQMALGLQQMQQQHLELKTELSRELGNDMGLLGERLLQALFQNRPPALATSGNPSQSGALLSPPEPAALTAPPLATRLRSRMSPPLTKSSLWPLPRPQLRRPPLRHPLPPLRLRHPLRSHRTQGLPSSSSWTPLRRFSRLRL